MRAAMSVARSASSLICRVFHNEVMQTVAAVSSQSIGDLFTDMPRAFDFDDVSLVPRVHSTLAHRTEALPTVDFGPLRLTIPLIGSPMPDVCGVDMCRALGEHGALGILPRFQSIDEQAAELARGRRRRRTPRRGARRDRRLPRTLRAHRRDRLQDRVPRHGQRRARAGRARGALDTRPGHCGLPDRRQRRDRGDVSVARGSRRGRDPGRNCGRFRVRDADRDRRARTDAVQRPRMRRRCAGTRSSSATAGCATLPTCASSSRSARTR